MQKYSSKFKIVILLSVVMAFPLLAVAQTTTDLPTGFSSICSREAGLASCIQQLYVFALGFGALVALLMLILAGYRYMTASGNAQQLAAAKEALASAFIGLIILFVAFILLYLINPDLVRFSQLEDTLTLPKIVAPAPIQTPPNPLNGTGGSQPSVITRGAPDSSSPVSVREMDFAVLGVFANDPEGDTLSYRWVIEEDPTGKAVFVGASNQREVRVGVQQGSLTTDSATSVFDRQEIVVRADVSDGQSTVSQKWTVVVNGYNRPPVARINGKTGTPNFPIITGYAINVDSNASSDPDGVVSFRSNWGVKIIPPDQQCTPGGIRPAGTEGAQMGFTVPELKRQMQVEIELLLQDGLHEISETVVAYLAPDNTPCAYP